MYHAGSALTGIAAYMSTCFSKIAAYELDQKCATFNLAAYLFAVHRH